VQAAVHIIAACLFFGGNLLYIYSYRKQRDITHLLLIHVFGIEYSVSVYNPVSYAAVMACICDAESILIFAADKYKGVRNQRFLKKPRGTNCWCSTS
jgi:hypothetical protein